jgi:DNA-binding NarL/FixJ family response regulator
MGRTRIVIVDDNREFREVLEMLLPRRFDVIVDGSHADPKTALAALRKCGTDIVLVDYKMPGMNGIEFIRETQSLTKPPRAFLISFQALPALCDAARDAGAVGVLSKTDVERDLAPHLPPRPQAPQRQHT